MRSLSRTALAVFLLLFAASSWAGDFQKGAHCAGQKTVSSADEEGFGRGLSGRQCVHRESASVMRRPQNADWQQRHAESRRNATHNCIYGAEFKLA